MKKIVFILIVLFTLCSCTKYEQKAKEVKLPYNSDDGVVTIIFGNGYNSAVFIENTLEAIKKNYNLTTLDNIIFPVVYPDNFKYDGITRVSMLSNILAQHKISALIILGSPDNMHYALGKMYDQYSETNENQFPVFSLFPQDDVLGTEANSDMVFDFADLNVIEEVHNSEEETALKNIDKVPELVSIAVKSVLEYKTNIAQGKDLEKISENFFGTSWNITSYRDAETGVRSNNHFLIEEKIDPKKIASLETTMENKK